MGRLLCFEVFYSHTRKETACKMGNVQKGKGGIYSGLQTSFKDLVQTQEATEVRGKVLAYNTVDLRQKHVTRRLT